MPKTFTNPELFDHALKLSTTDLKRAGCLVGGVLSTYLMQVSGALGEPAVLKISVDVRSRNPFIEFDHAYGRQHVNYRVELIRRPSNLRMGYNWFFVCPSTGKSCRVLYSINGHFLHRDAFPGAMYKSQTRSKEQRKAIREWAEASAG